MKDLDKGFIVIIVIIALALFSGAKNAKNPQYSNTIPTPSERQLTQSEIEQKVKDLQREADTLQKEQQITEEKKKSSEYKGRVYMNIYTSSDAQTEYVDIYTDSSITSPINITGWKLLSTSTNQSTVIPQTTLLYFSGQKNSEQDVLLGPNQHAYIITGKSPTGYGQRINKCSGYLSQYMTFYPSIYSNCPSPRTEDYSKIPKRIVNDNCFDLIESLSSCRIPDTLSKAYSSECQEFLTEKINYPYCIAHHKDDTDFWGNTWYVYLKRSDTLWRNRRDTTILYDSLGKPVVQVVR
jgi:hypothetical protein